MDHASIAQLLKEAMNLQAEVSLTPLDSGDVNKVYKLTSGDVAFAVKWVGEDTFSGIDRFHQFVLQEQLAQRNLAPKPVWLSDDGRLWVEQWIDTTRVPVETDVIYTLASVLADIHSQPITARPLNLETRWQHYIDVAALESSSPLVVKSQQLTGTVRQAMASNSDWVLCHNDLSYGHIIDQQHHIVVDWEYSAMGNRFFDLASCAVINELSEKQSDRLCFYYAEKSDLPLHSVTKSFATQQELVFLTNELWQAALEATADQKLDPPVIL